MTENALFQSPLTTHPPLEKSLVTLFVHPATQRTLSTVPIGGRKEVDFWLENAGGSAVEIDQFEIHCTCLTFTPERLTIESGKKAQLRAKVDFKGDEREHNLGIDVKGLTKSGDVVLKLVVHVQATGNRQQATESSSRQKAEGSDE